MTYAAMIGTRCVDVCPTKASALQHIQSYGIPNRWVLGIPTGSTLDEMLTTHKYKGQELYGCWW